MHVESVIPKLWSFWTQTPFLHHHTSASGTWPSGWQRAAGPHLLFGKVGQRCNQQSYPAIFPFTFHLSYTFQSVSLLPFTLTKGRLYSILSYQTKINIHKIPIMNYWHAKTHTSGFFSTWKSAIKMGNEVFALEPKVMDDQCGLISHPELRQTQNLLLHFPGFYNDLSHLWINLILTTSVLQTRNLRFRKAN